MKTAIVTASYRGDFERCRLLCESIDRRATGYTDHFILVERPDLDLFSRLSGPRRRIVDERALLPSWLRAFPDPLALGRRRVWLSTKGPPLRGWHVQQLRKIAMASIMAEDAALFCDSDTVFLKDTDLADQWSGAAFAFYARPGAISGEMALHRAWAQRAGTLLGLPTETVCTSDYIAQSLGWRSDTVRAMIERIESVSGRSWVSAVAARRKFSECMIYGRFVEEIEARPDRHRPTDTPICHSYWSGQPMTAESLLEFVGEAGPRQPMVGVQSFIGTDVDLIRRATGLA